MNPRVSHRLLWIFAACMLGAAVSAIALAAVMPIPQVALAAGTEAPAGDSTIAGSDRPVSRAQLDQDAIRPLRQPLADTPSPPAAPPTIAPSIPLPPLVGTIVEPGRSVALLELSGKSIDFKHIGDVVADAKIVAIDVTGITVLRGGRSSFIPISAPPQRDSAGGRIPITGAAALHGILSTTKKAGT